MSQNSNKLTETVGKIPGKVLIGIVIVAGIVFFGLLIYGFASGLY